MNSTIRHILSICLFLGLAITCQAQDFTWEQEEAAVEVRSFDETRRQQYLADEAYEYDRHLLEKDEKEKRNLQKEQSGFWERVGSAILSFFFDDAVGSLSWGEVMLYVFAVLGSLFFVLIYFKVDVRSAFRREGKRTPVTLEDMPRDIQQLDFEQLIARATQSGNYREAVRLLYLETLKVLSKTNRIQWKINKTNQDYLYELRTSPLRREFSDLTLRYEYVWYGDFEVGKRGFEAMQGIFRRFQAKVT